MMSTKLSSGWIPIFAFLLMTTNANFAGSQIPNGWRPPSEPVYVVITNTSSEGSSSVETKFGDLLMMQIYPEIPEIPGKDRIDGAAIYKTGTRVALYVDAQRRGDVRIEQVKEHQCNSAAALVVPTLAGLSPRVMGVATNSTGISSHPPSRRNATAAERVLAIRVANQEFRRAGVTARLAGQIKEATLGAIEVGGPNPVTFVGSFYIQTQTERHDVFIIARMIGNELSTEYSRYSQTTDLDDFKDHESVGLIDHLDLNRDGIDEIILGIGGYESERYEIYSRQRERWELVSVSHVAGC